MELTQKLQTKLTDEENTLIIGLKRLAVECIQQHRYAGHDQTHTIRVHRLSRIIGEREKADLLVLEAAALLHDLGRGCERVDHAEKSAEIAENLLKQCQFPEDKIPKVLYAIRTHRFSKGEIPETLEAKILQDADRTDIGGATGIAMTFAYGGSKNMELYDDADPLARTRKLDDNRYVLDHFKTKLLRLPETIHTNTGRRLMQKRSKHMKSFVEQFVKEISLRE
jgi:uncharacterized protein